MQGDIKDPFGWGSKDPFGVRKGKARNKRLSVFTPKVEKTVNELPERIGSGVVGLGKKLTLGPLFRPRKRKVVEQQQEDQF